MGQPHSDSKDPQFYHLGEKLRDIQDLVHIQPNFQYLPTLHLLLQAIICQERQSNTFPPGRLEKIHKSRPFPGVLADEGLTTAVGLFNFSVADSVYFHLQTVNIQE